jgi:SAM-dependent methyltransferase
VGTRRCEFYQFIGTWPESHADDARVSGRLHSCPHLGHSARHRDGGRVGFCPWSSGPGGPVEAPASPALGEVACLGARTPGGLEPAFTLPPVNNFSRHYERGSGYWDGYSRGIQETAFLNAPIYAPYIQPDDVVLDFGCGSGAMLQLLPGSTKIGIEPGPEAADHARSLGLTVHETLVDVATGSVDVVVSNHALEHTLRPLDELKELHRVLRPGGRIVLSVPINDWRNERAPRVDDPDYHLYTWTPRLLGNLFQEAGFSVESARVVTHGWRHGFGRIKERSELLYNVASFLFAIMFRRRQIRVVAVHI